MLWDSPHRSRLLLRLSLLLCWLCIGTTSPAPNIESVMRPGDLIQNHAKWEEDCSKCHVRFDHIVTLEHGPDTVEEFHRVDLRAVTVQEALDKDRDGHRANDQEQPQHQAAVG